MNPETSTLNLCGIETIHCQRVHPHDGACEWKNTTVDPEYLCEVVITWRKPLGWRPRLKTRLLAACTRQLQRVGA